MTEDEIKLVEEYVNWLYPIKGKGTFTLSDVYAEKLGDTRLRDHPNWIGESNDIFRLLNKFGLMERKETNQEYLTPLAIEIYEVKGWKKYQTKINKKKDFQDRKENHEYFKLKYWWLIAIVSAIFGAVITYYVPKILEAMSKTPQEENLLSQPPQTKKENQAIMDTNEKKGNLMRDSI